MKEFVSISDRQAERLPAPARDGHFHQACQHWCFAAIACKPDESCQQCRRAAFNKRSA